MPKAPQIPSRRVWLPSHLPVATHNCWLMKRRTKRSKARGLRLASIPDGGRIRVTISSNPEPLEHVDHLGLAHEPTCPACIRDAVAKALAEHGGGWWEDRPAHHQDVYREYADVALRAYREATS